MTDGLPSWEIRQGHVLDLLRAMPDGCVQTCVTSPPYYGLRAYGTASQVWGGDPGCGHNWASSLRAIQSGGGGPASAKQISNTGTQLAKHQWPQAHCTDCEAWQGELGSEPTAALFVAHLVEVFCEVRRVLRDDGVCFLNIGDSYAGSGKGPTGQNGIGDQAARQGFTDLPSGGRPKSLLLVPERLALALADDGWIIRSRIAWCKKAPMPESVRDRPTSAWEHIWMLAKSGRYFWDQEAVKEPASKNTHPRGHGVNPKAKVLSGNLVGWYPRHKQNESFSAAVNEVVAFRNQRNVWLLGTEAFPGAHFATFPTEIPRRCILAGSRPGDLVLDPFSGSGTTVLVANRLGRRAIGLELNPTYAEMARRRIVGDAPLIEAIDQVPVEPEQMPLVIA